MTVTRSSVRSVKPTDQELGAQGVNQPTQQDVVQERTGRGARAKVGTRRLGEYASVIPRAALTAKLPTNKKKSVTRKRIVVDPDNSEILRDSQTNRPLYALMAQRKKDRPLKVVEVGVVLNSPDGRNTEEDIQEFRQGIRGLSLKGRQELLEAAHQDLGVARAQSFDHISVDETDENTVPNYRLNSTRSREIVPGIGNLKTTGLDDKSTRSISTQPSIRNAPHGGSPSRAEVLNDEIKIRESQERVNLKYKEIKSATNSIKARSPDNREVNNDRRQGSQRSNRMDQDDHSRDRVPRPPSRQGGMNHNSGGGDGGGDDSSSSYDGEDTSNSHNGVSAGDSSILSEDGTRFRDMFNNDPNGSSASMNIPHWVMWTAGVKRIDHRYVIINTLGLNTLLTFTFIKEDAVVRMSKAVRKSHRIYLSEAELAMIWTAIGIVQMALMNKKPVTPDTIRDLVTPDELVRAYNINELNKTKSSTMEDIKPPTIVTLNNITWKNWYQQLIGYFKTHPNCTKETSLYYVIREPLPTEKITLLPEGERRAYDLAHDETSAVYIRDRTQVWGILHSQLNGQGAYGHIKPYEITCDATAAMNALRRAYEGASMRNSRLREAYERISTVSYDGNERSFPFSKFIETLLTNYQTIEDYDARVSDRNKITHMLKRINVRTTQIEMAIHNVQEDMDKNGDIKFDDVWPRIQTAITGSDIAKGRRNVSTTRRNGTGHEKGKRNNGRKVRFDDKKTENGVDISDVTSQFTSEQWNALSEKTKTYIRKRRKALIKGKTQDGKSPGKDHRNSHRRDVAVLEQLKTYIDERFSNVSSIGTGNNIKGILKKNVTIDNSDGDSYFDEPQPRRSKKSKKS